MINYDANRFTIPAKFLKANDDFTDMVLYDIRSMVAIIEKDFWVV